MKYSFNAYGHENILGTHQTTIEFTKDKELSLRGTCIIGIKADFESDGLREFSKKLINENQRYKEIKDFQYPLRGFSRLKSKILINENESLEKKALIRIKIKNDDVEEEVIAEVNPDFHDDKDMVIRKSNFLDKRTFAINADKSSFELKRDLVDKLKDRNVKIDVEVSNL